MTYDELIESLEAVERQVEDSVSWVSPSACGLDQRSAHKLGLGDGFIVCRRSDVRRLDYYGGFEYVDRACTVNLLNFVIYSSEDRRVADALEHAYDQQD